METLYVLRKKESLGCCNLVIWDFIIIAFVAGYAGNYYFKLHTLFCILIGLIAGVIFIALMGIKYIGKIFQIICAVFWAYVFWSWIGLIFPYPDAIWKWGVFAILSIVCIALHFASAHEIIGENEHYNYSNIDNSININERLDNENLQLDYDRAFNQYTNALEEREQVMMQAQNLVQRKDASRLYHFMLENDQTWSEGSAKLETYFEMIIELKSTSQIKSTLNKISDLTQKLQNSTRAVMLEINRMLSEDISQGKSSNNDIDESLFAGCTDKESLTKRYKNLMRTFHPDNADGDTAMTVKIKNTYEELLKKF